MSNLKSKAPPPRDDGPARDDGDARVDRPPHRAPPRRSRDGIDEVERLLADARALARQTLDESMARAGAVFAQRWSSLRDPMLGAVRDAVSDFAGIARQADGIRGRLTRFEALLQEPAPRVAPREEHRAAVSVPPRREHEPSTASQRSPGLEGQGATAPLADSPPDSSSRPRPRSDTTEPAPLPPTPPLARRGSREGEEAGLDKAVLSRPERAGSRSRARAVRLPRWRPARPMWWGTALGLSVLIALPAVYGWHRWRQPDPGERGRALRVRYYAPYSPIRDAGSDNERLTAAGAPEAAADPDLVLGPPGSGAGSPAVEPLLETAGVTAQGETPAEQRDTSMVRLGGGEPATAIRTTGLQAPTPEVASGTDRDAAASQSARTSADERTSAEVLLQDLSTVAPNVSGVEAGEAPSFEPVIPAGAAGQDPPVSDDVTTSVDAAPSPLVPVETAASHTALPREPASQPVPAEPERTPSSETPAVRRGELASLTDDGVAPPVRTVDPRPEYPRAAQTLRREATLELRVLVDEEGRPARIEPIGDQAGLGFDQAARRAVRDARWRPATRHGVPVKVWVRTTVTFRLDGR